MAAEPVGAVPSIGAVIESLIPIAREKMHRVWGVKNEMEKLHGFLNGVKDVLVDAEKQQEERGAVKIWLQNVKDVTYDAEDVLDAFAYGLLRREMGVRKGIKVKNFFSPSNNLAFCFRTSRRIRELNQRLGDIARETEALGLSVSSSTSQATNYNGLGNGKTFSCVDSSEIVGREVEKSKIINFLVNDSSDDGETCSAVRIVGTGGVGKTALAQSVFGDQLITDHFGADKLWVCVSQNSDQKEIFGKILELIEKKKCEFSCLELILSKIKVGGQGKRYLIVLDDIWIANDNEWDRMFEALLFVFSKGTKVIVTTRSDEDVSGRSTSSYTHRLEGLSEDDCWSLFDKIAFQPGGVEKRSDLIGIGKNISKKCGGVPLAIKIIAGLMSKTDEAEWQSVALNDIWELQEGEQKVTRILKLSYDYLEPNLKRCFSYCSLFPKGHIIKKKKLIRLWMAEGFLSCSKANKEMEEIGSEYFDFLLANTFFQEERKDWFGSIESCRMHDLLHDLALSVAGTEYCAMLDVNRIHEMEVNRLRHVCFAIENECSNKTEAMYKLKNLRTFISSAPKLINNTRAPRVFTNFSCLRVLDLSDSAVIDLPSSVAKLKHLRYLDLSNSQVTNLPDSISSLYNLQTLILENCFKLKDLPGGMKELVSLRHLIICKTGDHDWIPPVPSKVGNLNRLRSLPVFTVGNKTNGYGIEELRDLNLLGDKLKIRNLENVSDRKEAEAGCLKDKQYIISLELFWSDTRSRSDVARDDFEVLDGLLPHQNLKFFGIKSYTGSKFSTWMMNLNNLLPNLTHVGLDNCSKCVHLPPLGLLRHLQTLYIGRFDAVKVIGGELYGTNSSNISSFPSLQSLYITHMVNLEEWSGHISSSSSSSSSSDFPLLNVLYVSNCPKLMITPTRFPSLKTLEYAHSNGEPIKLLVGANLASLTSILITDSEKLVFLPQSLVRGNDILGQLKVHNCKNFKGFNPDQDSEEEDGKQVLSLPNNSLRCLDLFNCPGLLSWPDLQVFDFLSVLSIYNCKSQKHIPSGIEYLPRLEFLLIGGFSEELDSFPFPVDSIEEGNPNGRYFPSLCNLCIKGWPKLNCLPDQIQHLTSLDYLRISVFGSLEVLPEYLGNLASLRVLELHHCENLKYMPSREQMMRLTSLEKLEIMNCPSLADRCKPGGEEYNKISHIPKVEFSE